MASIFKTEPDLNMVAVLTRSFAKDIPRIADALERIATAAESADSRLCRKSREIYYAADMQFVAEDVLAAAALNQRHEEISAEDAEKIARHICDEILPHSDSYMESYWDAVNLGIDEYVNSLEEKRV